MYTGFATKMFLKHTDKTHFEKKKKGNKNKNTNISSCENFTEFCLSKNGNSPVHLQTTVHGHLPTQTGWAR